MSARVVRLPAALGFALAACGAPPAPPAPPPPPELAGSPATIRVAGGDSQVVPVAGPAGDPAAVVLLDGAGQPLGGVPVSFLAEGGGWVTDSAVVTGTDGTAATTWYVGPRTGEYRLIATAGALQATFTATAAPRATGASHFGTDGYIEFVPGRLPIIISVPHGGSLEPPGLPDRAGEVITVRDAHTEELARDIAHAFARRTGSTPTLVISRLHRRKLDPNRPIEEAAGGVAAAELAWREYHAFIEAARADLVAAGRRGLYIDLHGHGHEAQRLELGYLLDARDLALSEATLNSPALVARSSLRALLGNRAAASAMSPPELPWSAFDDGPATPSHAELLRGASSLGSLFERRGYTAVPSGTRPDPGLAPYFAGGYSLDRHASRDGGLIAGVQVEVNRAGIRDSEAGRRAFADAFAAVILEFAGLWLPQAEPRAASGGR